MFRLLIWALKHVSYITTPQFYADYVFSLSEIT